MTYRIGVNLHSLLKFMPFSHGSHQEVLSILEQAGLGVFLQPYRGWSRDTFRLFFEARERVPVLGMGHAWNTGTFSHWFERKFLRNTDIPYCTLLDIVLFGSDYEVSRRYDWYKDFARLAKLLYEEIILTSPHQLGLNWEPDPDRLENDLFMNEDGKRVHDFLVGQGYNGKVVFDLYQMFREGESGMKLTTDPKSLLKYLVDNDSLSMFHLQPPGRQVGMLNSFLQSGPNSLISSYLKVLGKDTQIPIILELSPFHISGNRQEAVILLQRLRGKIIQSLQS